MSSPSDEWAEVCQHSTTAYIQCPCFTGNQKYPSNYSAGYQGSWIPHYASHKGALILQECSECKASLGAMFTDNEVFKPPPPLLCHQGVSQSPSTILLTWHSRYSTHLHEEKEMMKTRGCACIPNTQVHYPSNPQQPGPVYFLTPKKCAIFGVCCEGVPRQIQVYALYNAYMYIPSIKNIHKIYLLIQGILPDWWGIADWKGSQHNHQPAPPLAADTCLCREAPSTTCR